MLAACASADVPAGSALRVVLEGVEVCVARADDGTVHAVNDLCTHGEVSLAEGEVLGCAIECWLHGSAFSLETGVPESPPAFEPVAVYACDERDGTVFVDPTTTK
ncbi:Rieske 2Fe-2S domain-containing protein [Brevibacterium sp. 5221]|uniref:Rieske 2Fe-2S domain-containing protein n=1 Tax=Brevibacterium rongguiense TaxID=2695267 RepID=A0A6N9H6D0_9MICO|nr:MULTISPECIES: non-heme iron oxygenase ferredoxin subunit [Brevibacterium]MYM19154.1 Rieske 2Fe-2S domain-containing protein [Brevibacterium rongguiense]WAL41584.1 non-heme iron oxygenase ferredoxin subunit [Brevibacterium sp. BRM-1]